MSTLVLLHKDAQIFKPPRPGIFEVPNSIDQLQTDSDIIDALNQATGQDFAKWVSYNNTGYSKRKEHQNFEMFCWGYVTYHDKNVIHNPDLHWIFLKWDDKDDVRIFMSPPAAQITPEPLITDPPTPPPPPPPPSEL